MANAMFPWGNMPITEADPEIADLIEKEKNRQWRGLELIASEVCARFFICALDTSAQWVVIWSGRREGPPATYGGLSALDTWRQAFCGPLCMA